MESKYLPKELYKSDDLMAGYGSGGITRTFDFAMYQTFVKAGAATPRTITTALDFATHDAHIADALRKWIEAKRPNLVGIMGGHSVRRNHPAYEAVARLARTLTDRGYTVVSGGGPGVMEAAHLGAAASGSADAVLEAAIGALSEVVALPDLTHILDDSGEVVPDISAKADKWFTAAWAIRRDLLPEAIGSSLAIPTWLYGNEPTIPFATDYAKFFNNSIREQALVSRSLAGIIYARGNGGTLREIFEDLEENYYARSEDAFTPMIFFDLDDYWRTTGDSRSEGINVDDLVLEAVRYSKVRSDIDPAPFLRKVMFGTDVTAILDLLDSQTPKAAIVRRAILDGSAASYFMRQPEESGS